MRVLLAGILALGAASSTAHATPYRALFEPGSHWTYRVEDQVWFGVSKPDTAPETATIECRVTAVARIGAAQVSTVECTDSPRGIAPVAGTWIATRRGLWRADEHPESPRAVARQLRARPMVLAARPRPRRARELADGMGSRRSVSGAGDAWCVDEEDGDPNGGSEVRTCFAGGSIAEVTQDGAWYSEGGGGSHTRHLQVPLTPARTAAPW